jgi:hypothetical protein
MLGRLDFYPNHKLLYAPENVSSALSQFIEGFDVIFHCIDRVQSSDIKMQPPSYLIGDTTEKRMARFVQRIGFDVIDFNEVGYTVIGETDHVRRKHAALKARSFKGSRLEQRVMKRAKREEERISRSSRSQD